ncbi:YlbF family regulator [Enterococcus timonensis]|uniref:YlbF family regulator n=1 Tax=Enterococcus timonensis TaxID=1852364 RepID=UPI0008D9C28E|nr:YlbF family regulator [Enterococcus timonensis]
MIYTSETAVLEDLAEQLVEVIWQSELGQNYLECAEILENDSQAQKLKLEFLEAKENFQQISEYGKFTPGFKEAQRTARQKKRQLDMWPTVAEFKAAETALQEELDVIAQQIAATISPTIKVDYGNPFFHQESHHHCQGGK